MRCVAYCRVSTPEVEQKNSLNNQIDYYTELFRTKGYTPAKIGIYCDSKGVTTQLDSGVFADEGITGTKKKNRKAFQYLIKCSENKEFDIIYCKNIQRFARNVEEGAGILKRLKQLGIKVIFEEGNLDSSNPSHEFIINQLLGLAQQESQSKSEAVKWGVRKAQKKGKWTSNTPYGYNRVGGFLQRNPKKKLLLNKSTVSMLMKDVVLIKL
jgi:DNA invertase Pin-like site-specific DNA recombinase